jgi:F-type H+-transporting ATPase subunit epsilon
VSTPFRVQVVSPESIVWSGEATMVVTRTTEGEIGILADHEPTMAALSTGSTVVHTAAGPSVTIATHGGFLQIAGGEVTLLADRALLAEGDAEAAMEMARAMAAEEGASD